MGDIAEKYSELKEELDNKNPLVRYALLREELDNKDPLKRYAHIKKELEYIKTENVKKLEEDNKKREENTLEAMESLFHSLGGEESDIENQSIIVDEQPQELVSEEEVANVEKIDIQEEQPINGFKSVIDVISKQEARKEKLQEQPNDPVSTRIEKLEKWIRKIAGAGAGSGEVRLLNLDDVNTTDLANNKYLKYNSSTGKFVFADASGGGGSAHTIQNAGSDLTARDNLNFDGTYVIATDDSGNDQSDITLSSALQSWHTKARPSGVVVGTTDSQTLTNKTLTSAILNTSISGTAVSVTSGSTSITTALDDIAINTQILDTPVGYISLVISGTSYKIPYYSA